MIGHLDPISFHFLKQWIAALNVRVSYGIDALVKTPQV